LSYPLLICSQQRGAGLLLALSVQILGPLLQLHNPPSRQCCLAENAYALLTYFQALRTVKRQVMSGSLSFWSKMTSVALKSGGLRTASGGSGDLTSSPLTKKSGQAMLAG
jgi:hypothetical protein